MSIGSKVLKVGVPVIILAGGIVVMAGLVTSRQAPKKEATLEIGALVNTVIVHGQDMRVTVRGTGTVQAAQSVTVIPEVSGRITAMAPAFVAGGFFRTGEPLFEIDKTDYRLALEQAEAAMARAEYDLARIQSQARVARSEWKRLDRGNEPNPLVLYEPQLKDAGAALKSASASVERVRVDLERTRVLAPFNGRVSSEEIDLGQYVKAGSPVAVLAGTDSAEIIVPLPLDELRWIDIPRGNGAGALAEASMTVGERFYSWKGSVVRSHGEVGLKDRMMQVVVTIADPYGLAGTVEGRPALAVGTFVDVAIEGSLLKGVYAIPRRALRDSSTVWTVDKEKRLRIRKVKAARIEQGTVIVIDGLVDDDTVVVTTLSGAADGMKLRTVEEGR